MNEEKLREIEEGLDRWHSVSPDVAKLLIAEIRRRDSSLALLREARTMLVRAENYSRHIAAGIEPLLDKLDAALEKTS